MLCKKGLNTGCPECGVSFKDSHGIGQVSDEKHVNSYYGYLFFRGWTAITDIIIEEAVNFVECENHNCQSAFLDGKYGLEFKLEEYQ